MPGIYGNLHSWFQQTGDFLCVVCMFSKNMHVTLIDDSKIDSKKNLSCLSLCGPVQGVQHLLPNKSCDSLQQPCDPELNRVHIENK